MKKRPDVRIKVQSFTDSRGKYGAHPAAFPTARPGVPQALVERGVPASRISAEGRGEIQPVASNDTSAGREKNRRVEIVVSDAAGHFWRGGPAESEN
jgi:outer membrane protein OmpA-like peptidoglycan-associated protein